MGIEERVRRIIDANLNRLAEGLRVMEEFARFVLNDAGLTQRLKDLRHEVLAVDADFQIGLLEARDAGGDIGADMEAASGNQSRDPTSLVVANARRVQESLRVLEELAMAPDSVLDYRRYRRARFEAYTLEKELVFRLQRRKLTGKLAGLYVIIDVALLGNRSVVDVAGQVVKGGAGVVQLRAKGYSAGEFFKIAQVVREICRNHGALFIINDSLELALASEADGLHVGQDDLPVVQVRKWLPPDRIIGCSVDSVEEARRAAAAGADYLGAGAVFPTTTKQDAPVIGLEGLTAIVKAVNLPVVAIGGIDRSNIASVMASGAVAAAVISAVMGAPDVTAATRQLIMTIEEAGFGKS